MKEWFNELSNIARNRIQASKVPAIRRYVVAIDPATTSNKANKPFFLMGKRSAKVRQRQILDLTFIY